MRAAVLAFAGLLVLTSLTLGLSFAPLGSWHIPVALLIAGAKAVLVALVFMDLVAQRATNWIAIVVALLLLAVFIGLSSLDVLTRVLFRS
jgi:cytochrome c oxidase subunit 4